MEAATLEREIIFIPAKAQPETQRRQLRTAAYCRVSTDSDEQESSYANQVGYYTDKIASNPEWTMAGIYADVDASYGLIPKKPASTDLSEFAGFFNFTVRFFPVALASKLSLDKLAQLMHRCKCSHGLP